MDFSLPVDRPPLISVLIRSMNRPSLAATLESVARQQWPNLEIIIVAACGAAHPEPPARVLDHPVRLVRSERPLRRSEAANAGLDAARGDLLCFLDDDDALLPGHFEPLVEALRTHPQAVAAYSGTSAETPDGHVLRVYGRPFDRTDLYLENCFPIHSVLFRREAVLAGARFDPAFDLCEDWDFWLQVARCGDFVYCEAVTALYRITEDGGYALQGDGQTAYLAERAVLEKWRTLHSADALHAIAERGRLVRTLQHQLAQEEAISAQQQQRIDTLETEREEHLRKIAWQEERIEDLLHSTSWRITAPLRKISPHVRKVLRVKHALRALSGAQWRNLLRHLACGRLRTARQMLAAAARSNVPLLPAPTPCAAPALWALPAPVPAPLPFTVDVLIPVYNGMEYLPDLFDSLARARSTPFRLLIGNDASPDAAIQPFLQQQAERLRALDNVQEVVLLENAQNLGFVGTVNRLAQQVQNDFVLLNTDTQVPQYWLERLFAPMLADSAVASVTPFTNAGAICSFPEFFVDNELPAGMTVDDVDAVFARIKDLPAPALSSAVGFCMAIRRSVVQQIGLFDPAFGKGYREENDWCERARAQGFRHVLAANLFVQHKHGGSFSCEEKATLSDRNGQLLRQRHPGVFEYYQDFISRDPLAPLRRFLHLLVLAQAAARPVFVLIENAIPGGAREYALRLMEEKQAAGVPVLRLIDDFRTRRLEAHWLHDGREVQASFQGYAEWGRLLAGMAVEEVFINNLYSFRSPPQCLDWLADWRAQSDAPLTLALHDFFMLCPSLFLMDHRKQFCNLPEGDACTRCFSALPLDFPVDCNNMADWRARWGALLAATDRILAFSDSSRRLLTRIYPECAPRITLQPHSMAHFAARPVSVPLDKPLTIGIVGAIGWQKGWPVLKDLCDTIEREHFPARIEVIGTLHPEFDAPCMHVSGRYQESDLPARLQQSGANIFLMPAIWPETFSYVSHELIACGVPFCCFDMGAPADAARAFERGQVFPVGTSAIELLRGMEAFRQELLAHEAADAAAAHSTPEA